MKRKVVLFTSNRSFWIIILYLVLFYLLFIPSAQVKALPEFTGEVIDVSDGDTIKVRHIMIQGKFENVSLAGIDCPEENQAFGKIAKKFTSEMVLGKEVTIGITKIDPREGIIGEVTLPDGKSLNRELVKAGLAWRDALSARDSSLGELEAEARKFRLGLWADDYPIPPWEFRKLQKSMR